MSNNFKESEDFKVSAERILEQIERGEDINYDSVIIKGNLDCSMIFNQKNGKKGPIVSIDVSIKITNSRIDGRIEFGMLIFNKRVVFRGTQFDGSANFSGSQFNDEAIFENSIFFGYVNFNSSLFKDNANFRAAHFSKDVDFIDSKFNKFANFNYSLFSMQTHFNGSLFKSPVSFENSKFEDDVDFNRASFENIANFRKSDFKRIANFQFTKFLENICLNDATYYSLRLPWGGIRDVITYDGPVFISLIRNYKSLNWSSDAKNCYYDYRLRNRRDLTGFSRIVDYLERILTGYGQQPLYLLLAVIYITSFFGLIFWYFDAICLVSNSCSDLSDNSTSLYNSLLFSVIVFAAKIPTDLRPVGEFFCWLAVLEAIVGWVVLGVALKALTNLLDI